MAAGGEPSLPPQEAMLAIAPWYAGVTALGLLLYAAFEAACLRWMVRGERGGIAGLSLGGDTWLMVLTYVVWLLLGLLFSCLVGGLYYGLFLFNNAAPGLRIVSMLIGALAPLGFAALLIWLAVRLSPAAAASIAARKFAFFSAWGATRGRFWPMLGAFVILIAVYLGLSFPLSSLLRGQMTQWLQPAVEEAMRGGDFDAVFAQAGAAFSTPTSIGLLAAYMLASIVLSMVFYVCWFGVNAAAVAPRDDEAPADAAPAPPEPAAPVQAPMPVAPTLTAAAPAPVAEAPTTEPEPAPTPAAEAPPAPEVAPAPVVEQPAPEGAPAVAAEPVAETPAAAETAAEPETPAEAAPASEPDKPAS